jgi:hypothetical protein
MQFCTRISTGGCLQNVLEMILIGFQSHLWFYYYCYIVWSDYRRGFVLDIGFIDYLQVVTTNNYNTIAISTQYKITLSFPAHNVFSGSCLVTAFDNGFSSAPGFKSSPKGGSLPTDYSTKWKWRLLYDWRFTTNQFVLASGPLRPTTRDFFNWTLAVIVLT